MIDLGTYVVAAAIVLLAASVHGAAGYGIVMLSVPLLLAVFEPKAVVPIMLCLAILVEALVLIPHHAAFPKRLIVPLVVGACVGVLPGALILHLISAAALRVLIVLMLIPAALVVAFGIRRPIKAQTLGLGAIGLFSGILNATTGISGVPVALFLTNQGWDRRAFRAGLNAFFVVMDAFTVLVLLVTGVATPLTLLWALLLAPPAVLGYFAGARLWRLLSDRQLRWAVAGVALVGGPLALAAASLHRP